jgi:hypothetical protein
MISIASSARKYDKPINIIWFILLILTPLVLWILPGDFFDSENAFVVCPSRALFNIECLGCGMTRAVMHLHHFQFDDAVYFNRGSFLVYPALVAVWVMWTVKARKKVI